jgi:hypothetical protein
VRITDVVSEAEETLEFKDRVVAMNLSDSHLIICSPAQCYVYSLSALNTPIIVDIREPPVLVQQCEKFFAIVDTLGITVYNHDGRTSSHRTHAPPLPTFSPPRACQPSRRRLAAAQDRRDAHRLARPPLHQLV